MTEKLVRDRFTRHLEHSVPVTLGSFENCGGRWLYDTQSLIRVPSILVNSNGSTERHVYVGP
jgi:hypothetical protein